MNADPLNQLGMFLINMDYRYTAIGTLLLFGIIYLLRTFVAYLSRKQLKIWKVSTKGAGAGLLSLFSLYSAVKIGAVFLLTSPPACSQLDDSEVAIVGLVSLMILMGLGIIGVVEFCRREKRENQ